MHIHDKKAAVTLMMGRKTAKGDRVSQPTPMQPEVVKTEDGEMDGRHIAAQDAISALHEGSAEKLDQALRNHHDLHVSMSAQAPDEE
jgi:hypothetical protein